MKYHSEKITRTIILATNQREILKLVEITPQQVESGALLSATNSERKNYFTYGAVVMAWIIPFLTVPSALLMLLYMATLGLNVGLALCMTWWIPYFIANNLEKKAKHCNKAKELVVFSLKDLAICLLKAGVLGFILIGTIVWIVSSQ